MKRFEPAVAVLACLLVSGWANAQSANELVAAAGVKGGLVVQLGCGDGQLTADLRVNHGYLVQGLDADAGQVAKARERIRSRAHP